MAPSRIYNIIEHGTIPGTDSSNFKFAKELTEEFEKYKHGEILALRALVEKLRTFDPKVGLHALNMLEYCADNAGTIFLAEIGRNRFLNELAKMLSPKYDADKCPKVVKDRISLIFRDWSTKFPKQTKIAAAYRILVSKGYISEDLISPKKSPDESHALGDTSTNKKIQRLLRSSHPDDLVLANRIIKEMVQQEEKRSEKIHDRHERLSFIEEKIKMLYDMMANARSNRTSKFELGVFQEVRKVCESYHAELNNTANNAIADNDPYLNDIVQVSEDLTKVLNECRNFESTFNNVSQDLLDLEEIFGGGSLETPSARVPRDKMELGEQELAWLGGTMAIKDDDFLDILTPSTGGVGVFSPSNNLTSTNSAMKMPAYSFNLVDANSSTFHQPSFVPYQQQNHPVQHISPSKNTDPFHSLVMNFSGKNQQGSNNQTNTSNPLSNFDIDPSSIEIVKTVPLTIIGSQLTLCLAQGRNKSPTSADSLSQPPKIFMLSGVNMTTLTIEDITLKVSSSGVNSNENVRQMKLSNNTTLTPYNPILPPSVYTSLFAVTPEVSSVTLELQYTVVDNGNKLFKSETLPVNLSSIF